MEEGRVNNEDKNGETVRNKKTKKVFTKDALQDMSREELQEAVLQVSAHNTQLQALLRRTLADAAGNSVGKKKYPNDRPFDFSKHGSRHVLLLFAYLGWDYQGYAVQEDTLQTIEAVLFDALFKTKLIPDRQSSNYHRCGRTDKGVSAFSQVVSLTVRSKTRRPVAAGGADTDSGSSEAAADDEDDKEIQYVDLLNRVLPPEVRMLAWSPAPPGFSARFDCTSRTYKYFFPRGSLDIERMREAGRLLEGSHDFRNLCKMDVGNGVVNFQRTVDAVTISLLEDDCRVSSSASEQPHCPETDFIITEHIQGNTVESNQTDAENFNVTPTLKDSEKGSSQSCNISSSSQLYINSSESNAPELDKNSSHSKLNNPSSSVSSDKNCPGTIVASENVQSRPTDPPGFTMCIATIRSKAFLWHQVRAMMAVLFLVGEGNEEPSIITQLMDVEKNPRKPQYSLASEVPLCLFETEYPSEVVRWRYNKEALARVIVDLQHAWAQQAIRCGMIRRMLAALPGLPSQDPLIRQHSCLTPAAQPKVYRPLLERHTCESLENKVEHYVKRRRLDASVLSCLPGAAAGAAGEASVSDGGVSDTTNRQDLSAAAAEPQ